MYNFQITYRKGSENAKADALSRRADYIDRAEENVSAILCQGYKETIEFNHAQLAATSRVEDLEWGICCKQEYGKDAIA